MHMIQCRRGNFLNIKEIYLKNFDLSISVLVRLSAATVPFTYMLNIAKFKSDLVIV
jgi:hypothetical protein